ncbi:hypothetical protein L873DRAFT_1385500 [Choiromyces venosus 120613-1]|uniref:Uncharacterized protein n=1 Tax=Choiromyces venosus 120613-1 TaxID=1336337 RepID=A0A3N4JLS3_9PEZI|nr:hypothetical protein L873DRAFT_1385500 [Choiromyces venosus 120613-1]
MWIYCRSDGEVVRSPSSRTPPDDSSGSAEYYSDDPTGIVVLQHTQVCSGTINPALRRWLDQGSYLFGHSSESTNSEGYIETSNGEESTASLTSMEFSEGCISDAPGFEGYPQGLILCSALLSSPEENNEV